MKYILQILVLPALLLVSCRHTSTPPDPWQQSLRILSDSITHICAEYPAEIGVAAIFDCKDTLLVNDRNVYPMMSVFKMHQAIAIADRFDHDGRSLDSVLTFSRASLDPNTWSPMLKDHSEPEIALPVKDLLRYTLRQSDNNASNLMFSHLVNVSATDSLISAIIPRSSFQIAYTEHEMASDHTKAYANSTSPLGAAILINRLFTDSILRPATQSFIKQTLTECATGQDRIAAPLSGKKGVMIAHKTGSGYSENGILVAHNDVAYITLPDSTGYALAVFVKDIRGNEKFASEAISRISEAVYLTMTSSCKTTGPVDFSIK